MTNGSITLSVMLTILENGGPKMSSWQKMGYCLTGRGALEAIRTSGVKRSNLEPIYRGD
nr:hypothetical protein VCHA53O474_30549 [Vibrio chagasii]